MTDDLVKRLRERYYRRASETEDEAKERRQRERETAATRIEADAAKIARLLDEAFEWCHKAMENFNRATKASQDAEAAEAKVAALVEALESIERETQNVTPELMNQQMALHSAASVARAAIAAAKGGK